MQNTALITGITGQDGSYLAEFLLAKGYRVFGLVRRNSTVYFERLAHFQHEIDLLPGDLLDQNSLITALRQSNPDEVYNLASQSFVPTSWNQPVLTGEFTALGVTRVLEAIRVVNPRIRFYQASSSETFGMVHGRRRFGLPDCKLLPRDARAGSAASWRGTLTPRPLQRRSNPDTFARTIYCSASLLRR